MGGTPRDSLGIRIETHGKNIFPPNSYLFMPSENLETKLDLSNLDDHKYTCETISSKTSDDEVSGGQGTSVESGKVTENDENILSHRSTKKKTNQQKELNGRKNRGRNENEKSENSTF
jgi:hypothetical protein